MTEKQAGVSALSMAYARAFHALYESPKIFEDFLAPGLFTPEELAQMNRDWANLLEPVAPELAAQHPDERTAAAWVVQLTNGPITLGRSRYAEDCLAEALARGRTNMCSWVRGWTPTPTGALTGAPFVGLTRPRTNCKSSNWTIL